MKRFALALVAACLLAGCTTQEITVRERDPQGFAPWSEAPVAHRLGVGDKVRISFPLTPENDEDVLVAPDGYIALKLIGRMEVQSLSVSELQDKVRAESSRFLINPTVVASLLESRSARIIIGGAVKTPGTYAVSARPTVMEAVMMAGGLNAESRMNEVVVLRMRPDNTAMVKRVNLQSFIARGDTSENIRLEPEDMVFVPRSRVAEVNWWIEEYINRNLPFGRSVQYSLNRNVTSLSPVVP